jgi:NAD(P)-dependent dehydrogenase (short-subunit alcohol dehydrogenase family)
MKDEGAAHDRIFDVSGKTVVITGASGQLGLRYAREFLERGANVVGADVMRSAGLEALGAEFPGRLLLVRADVTQKESLSRALNEIEDCFGSPQVIVNNAAIDSPPSAPAEENGPFEEYPEESWDRVLSVNLKGVFLCCQVFGAAMARSGEGSIINVASIYGSVSPDQGLYQYRRDRGEVFYKPVAYAASKSGVYNLTRYLAAYWGRSGVRVNTLTIAGVFNHQDPEFLEAYCGRMPMGRMANEDEFNGAVIFLASDASRYMTGADLVVDGGWTAI